MGHLVPATRADALTAWAGRKRPAHPASSTPAATGRARSITSGHETLPFRQVAMGACGLPAEPSPSTTAPAPEAATSTASESSPKPTHRSWPGRGVRRRVAIRGHSSRIRRSGIRPKSRLSAKGSSCCRVHVAGDRKPGTVSGRTTCHGSESKGSCSITCWHCYHRLSVPWRFDTAFWRAPRLSVLLIACLVGVSLETADAGRSSPASRMRPDPVAHR
jgi:hypothetical protein